MKVAKEVEVVPPMSAGTADESAEATDGTVADKSPGGKTSPGGKSPGRASNINFSDTSPA